MANIPVDAPRSEDGYYWWDGTRWQPVDQGDRAQRTARPMTDDLFANMVQAAESSQITVREA